MTVIISKTINIIKQKSNFSVSFEIIIFPYFRIVYHYVNRIKGYQYVIITLSDAMLSSQG